MWRIHSAAADNIPAPTEGVLVTYKKVLARAYEYGVIESTQHGRAIRVFAVAFHACFTSLIFSTATPLTCILMVVFDLAGVAAGAATPTGVAGEACECDAFCSRARREACTCTRDAGRGAPR